MSSQRAFYGEVGATVKNIFKKVILFFYLFFIFLRFGRFARRPGRGGKFETNSNERMEEMVETKLSGLSYFEFLGEETEFGNEAEKGAAIVDPGSGGCQTADTWRVGGLESALPWKARSEDRRPKERRFLNRRH